ncbi:MAG TPA: hypothetical protein PLS84_05495 [Salinivirgaceae bacterium]|nr:hypothetical protein [Salinivirgaceae bacterium]
MKADFGFWIFGTQSTQIKRILHRFIWILEYGFRILDFWNIEHMDYRRIDVGGKPLLLPIITIN